MENSMTKEAMKLALEALQELNETQSYWWQEVGEKTIAKIGPTIKALEEALKQEQGEPVGEAHLMQEGFTHCIWSEAVVPVGTKFYTAPPQRPSRSDIKPLTDEQIEEIAERTLFPINFGRAIEHAHGIKE